jgi:hypothetical protein
VSSLSVSQFLWPDKDREEWFSLEENHEKVLGSPGFRAARYWREQLCAAFFTESRMQFDSTTSLSGNPGSAYTNCETAVEIVTCIDTIRGGLVYEN